MLPVVRSCLIANDGSPHLDPKHSYYYQVQTQYHNVTQVSVSAHFQMVNQACILNGLLRHWAWKSCTEKVEHYFTRTGWKMVSPPISASLNTSAICKEFPTFCYCNRCEPNECPSSSEMIACDNPQCPTEWFHMKCLQLTRLLPRESGSVQTASHFQSSQIIKRNSNKYHVQLSCQVPCVLAKWYN